MLELASISFSNLLFIEPIVHLLNPPSEMTIVAEKDSQGLCDDKYRGTSSVMGN